MTHTSTWRRSLGVLWIVLATTSAFQSPIRRGTHAHIHAIDKTTLTGVRRTFLSPPRSLGTMLSVLPEDSSSSSSSSNENESSAAVESTTRNPSPTRWYRRILPQLQIRLVVMTPRWRRLYGGLVAAVSVLTVSSGTSFTTVAHAASAPVMALPKAEGRDPVTEALGVQERKLAVQTQQELNQMAATARSIEAEHGEAARLQYERDYKQDKLDQAARKQVQMDELKRSLLDQGMCPFVDLEGQRQVIALEKGVDLAKIPGTPFYLERLWETKSPAKSRQQTKQHHRRIVACMVQDMKNRDMDPLDYFAKHTDQTEAIYDMTPAQAVRLVQQYQANLDQYGQITVPLEGHVSAKDTLALRAASPHATAARQNVAKQQAAAAQAAAQQAKRAERQAAQHAKQAEQHAKKAEQAKKVEAAAAAVQQAKEAAARGDAMVEGMVPDVLTNGVETVVVPVDTLGITDGTVSDAPTTDGHVSTAAGTAVRVPSQSLVIGATIVTVGGGAYAFKVYRDNAGAKEEERREKLRLQLIGSGFKTTGTPLDIDVDVVPPTVKTPIRDYFDGPIKAPVVVEPPKKKGPTVKKPGIKSFFKKKSGRETNLMALVAADADAPEFATTLAKVLSLGAPGRFPSVVALPGGSAQLRQSMESLSPDDLTDILVQAQTEAGLSREQAAEVFANVVNCMLIQMVDLASTSLKEKDDKVTIDAINIVVDFMNHAASLYLAIAEGVTIQPVTYGGDLSKSKLEQMFATYASSSVMGMASGGQGIADDFDNRVSLLQDVFQINEKKAEGLMMKAMQKNMMAMMKDGKGMEGMEEMMKGLGGMDGMGGMGGLGGADGEGPSPEELKEMLTALKQMKDSGSIPPQEFDQVKKQFHEAFGSSIDDVVKEADANKQDLSATDKELVQLMKAIMDD